MSKTRKSTIEVQGAAITVLTQKEEDFISLTDIAKYREPNHADHLIQNWMRNRNTIEFLGIWERLNNPGFKPLEFEGFKTKAGLNSFVLTPRQWIDPVLRHHLRDLNSIYPVCHRGGQEIFQRDA